MEPAANVETFGSLWDRLESVLRSRTSEPGLFGKRLVAEACKEAAIAPYEPDLNNLVQLRNVLKHNEHSPLAEATAEARDFVRSMIALLSLTAMDIASKPVYAITETTEVADVTSEMESNVYTAVPVLRDGHIVGVFSEATAVRLLATGTFNGGQRVHQVGDLSELLDQPNQSDSFAHYRCTAGGTSATDIFDWFGDSTAAGVRLNAVFVTDTGGADSPPSGVITAWDLRKVRRGAAD